MTQSKRDAAKEYFRTHTPIGNHPAVMFVNGATWAEQRILGMLRDFSESRLAAYLDEALKEIDSK